MKSNSLFSLTALLIVLSSCSNNKTNEDTKIKGLEWAQEAVWYQIFPERFRNGNSANDPKGHLVAVNDNWQVTPWYADWDSKDPWMEGYHKELKDAFVDRRYGGDLQGIIDKVAYLDSLGITAIYINPIFDAQSMHKYDGSTYHHIDRFFGNDPVNDAIILEGEQSSNPDTWVNTNADSLFFKLIDVYHQHDIKVVIDGVFNHTGREFWAFKDVLKNQHNSLYKDWFDIISYDDPNTEKDEFDYHGWWGFKSLPEFKEEGNGPTQSLKNYIFASTKKWMDPNGDGDPSDGVDGWRLDVAQEVDEAFWVEWNAYVKQLNPQAYTTAEIWDKNPKDYLAKTAFDACMNYSWTFKAVDYFINKTISAEAYLTELDSTYKANDSINDHILMNLWDSHDTPRVLSMIKNPGLRYDYDAKPEDGYYISRPTTDDILLYKLMLINQYTVVGSPMMYYGTEKTMYGADDPHDRKPMLWDDMIEKISDSTKGKLVQDTLRKDLHNFVKKLNRLYKEHKTLSYGSFNIESVDVNQVLHYSRFYNGEKIEIIINTGSGDYILNDKTTKNIVFKVNNAQLDNNKIVVGANSALIFTY